jgi:membrane protein implicated in regulation of membrane protease activity
VKSSTVFASLRCNRTQHPLVGCTGVGRKASHTRAIPSSHDTNSHDTLILTEILIDMTVFWLVAGLVFCLMELVVPTAFIELTMGISAIALAFLSPFIPHLGLQVLLWIILSMVLTLVLRRLFPQKTHRLLEDSKEAETTTEILPGQTGRVLYEGGSWQARCSDERMAIASHQKVYVVGRKGTTLIVLPQNLLDFD